MPFPLRSPNVKTGGIVFFARFIDKIRLDAKGELPPGYHVGLVEGGRSFDDRFLRFVGVDYEPLRDRVLQGGSDEELLEWCFQNGRRPDAEQIEIWNTFLMKRGWNDPATPGLVQQRAEAGLAHREDLVTFFQVMDVEEGRVA